MDKKIAWVVGGTSGLGVSIVKKLLKENYVVVASFVENEKKAKSLVNQMNDTNLEVIKCDATDLRSIKNLIDFIITKYKKIDSLICCAGPFKFKHTEVIENSYEEFNYLLNGNLTSVFLLCKEILPYMRTQRNGRIITFGYDGAANCNAYSGYGIYAAAKSAVVSLTRTLAKEEASYGITINNICPSDIRDPYKEKEISFAKDKEIVCSLINRSGTGEDVARIVEFLLQEKSEFITGAVISVSGGYISK